MYNAVSKRITDSFVKNKVIDEDDRDVYDYGVKLLLSTLFSITVILITAVILKRLLPTVLFLIGFIIMRLCSGGYHANHYFTCFIVTMLNYAAFLGCIMLIPQDKLIYAQWAGILLSLPIILIFAPIENVNNRFVGNDRMRYRRRCVIFLIVASVAAIALLFAPKLILYSFSFMAGVYAVSLSVLVAAIQARLTKRRSDKSNLKEGDFK